MKLDRPQEWNSKDILFSLARIPDSKSLYIGSSDFRIYEFDTSAEKPERVEFTGEGHKSYVTGMTLTGNTLVTGSYDGNLIWWNLQERNSVKHVKAHDKWIRQIISTPDQTHIISVADDMVCKIWNAESGELVTKLEGHEPQTPHHYPSMLYAVAVSNDGKRIATGDRVGHVAIWDAESFEKLATVEAPGMYTWDPKARRHSIGGIRSLAFSPDAKQIAVGGIGKIGNIDHLGGPSRLEIFNWETDNAPTIIEDETKKGLIEELIWLENENAILGVGGDHKGFVNYYNPAKGELVAQAETGGHIHAANLDESETTLYTCGHNRVSVFKINDESETPKGME